MAQTESSSSWARVHLQKFCQNKKYLLMNMSDVNDHTSDGVWMVVAAQSASMNLSNIGEELGLKFLRSDIGFNDRVGFGQVNGDRAIFGGWKRAIVHGTVVRRTGSGRGGKKKKGVSFQIDSNILL